MKIKRCHARIYWLIKLKKRKIVYYTHIYYTHVPRKHEALHFKLNVYTRKLFDWLTHLYVTTFNWCWRSPALVGVFTLKFLLIIIYRRGRMPLCSHCARFVPSFRFVQWPSEAAIDMYQLYTREFQLYKRCAPVSVWRDADYAPRYQQQLIRIFTYSVLLPVYIQYLIFTEQNIENAINNYA